MPRIAKYIISELNKYKAKELDAEGIYIQYNPIYKTTDEDNLKTLQALEKYIKIVKTNNILNCQSKIVINGEDVTSETLKNSIPANTYIAELNKRYIEGLNV